MGNISKAADSLQTHPSDNGSVIAQYQVTLKSVITVFKQGPWSPNLDKKVSKRQK